MKIFLWSIFLFFVAALAFVIFYPGRTHTLQVVEDSAPTTLVPATIIDYINADRVFVRLAPLATNPYLMEMAQKAAEHMAKAQSVASVSDTEKTVKLTIDKKIYPYTNLDGLESRAATSTSTGSKEYAEHFNKSGSPFIPQAEDIGVGVAYDTNGLPYVSLIVGSTH